MRYVRVGEATNPGPEGGQPSWCTLSDPDAFPDDWFCDEDLFTEALLPAESMAQAQQQETLWEVDQPIDLFVESAPSDAIQELVPMWPGDVGIPDDHLE